jgi:hypothetical protein
MAEEEASVVVVLTLSPPYQTATHALARRSSRT